MKNLVIIGGKSPDSFPVWAGRYGTIIAADSGYDTAKRLGIVPDIVVGDFDSTSLSDELKAMGYKPCPRDKDDTDAALAIKESGGEYDLLGGGEGRLDHTLSLLATFRTLAPPSLWFMHADTIKLAVGRVEFSAPVDTDISIFALNESVVTTHGLKWDMDHAVLSQFFLSQSNRTASESVVIDADKPVFLRFFPSGYSAVHWKC
ncbi:MAG: thiamine pyrophosphokinase [Spirochaetes bacterium]|uniref:Thiamine pyrophosphokinase n=1 Tax=Candidatus Ornithospirochaeta stercoripullorum TaxID=2840899 RepID=A0A9D9E0S0_9SPIO|nr:thiamine pyrophosphokinase [Candidatus Ornithospirochaeta stercoripullorum]